jgi:hypothetical protein
LALFSILIRRSAFLCFAVLFLGCTKQLQQSHDDSINSNTIEPSVRVITPKEKAQFNNWIVREMYEQIYAKKATVSLFSWANVLNQGGSLEGVYHGMILSTEYTNREQGKANVAAVRFFAEEVALLKNGSAGKIAEKAMNYPLFSLKRQLGELILTEVVAKKEDRIALANFYGTIAARWAAKGVDFGLKERNNADEEFHKDWARKNSLGMIQWELLNRVHRIFNQYGGIILGDK